MEFHKSFMEFHKCDLWKFHKCHLIMEFHEGHLIMDLWNFINSLWNSINVHNYGIP